MYRKKSRALGGDRDSSTNFSQLVFFYIFVSRLGVLLDLSTCKHFRFRRQGKLKPIITQSLEYSAAATKQFFFLVKKQSFFFKNDVHLYNVGDPIRSILGLPYNYFCTG